MFHVADSEGVAQRRPNDAFALAAARTGHAPFEDDSNLDLWPVVRPQAVEDPSAAWFSMDRHACFLLEANCRILAANPQAEQMLTAQRAISTSGGILSFRCERSQQALRRAVAAVCRNGDGRQRNIVRGDDSEWRTIEVVARPDRSSAFATFTAGPGDVSHDMNTLSEAFGLTRTESCVLYGLINGRVPKEIAGELSISTHTVRSHLRAIYAKMDVKGIAGTIRLAMRLFH